jgi:hypothetical protein
MEVGEVSLLLIEGFEQGQVSNAKWNSVNVNATTAGRARTGSYGSEVDELWKNLQAPDEDTTLIVGLAWRRTGNIIGNDFIALTSDWNIVNNDADTIHVTLQVGSDRNIYVYRGDTSGTLLGNTTDQPVPNIAAYSYYEIKAVLADGVGGSVEVWLDGVQVLNLAGIDTKNGGTKTDFDSFKVYNGVATAGARSDMDDIYCCNGLGAQNNDILGDARVYRALPNGNGNYSQLDGSDGNSVNNFQLVDDAPPNDSDYVQSDVNGEIDSYAYENFTVGTGAVAAIQILTRARKSDTGAKSFRAKHRIGGTDYNESDHSLSQTFTDFFDIVELSPDTAVAWDETELNAAEWGVEVRP